MRLLSALCFAQLIDTFYDVLGLQSAVKSDGNKVEHSPAPIIDTPPSKKGKRKKKKKSSGNNEAESPQLEFSVAAAQFVEEADSPPTPTSPGEATSMSMF